MERALFWWPFYDWCGECWTRHAMRKREALAAMVVPGDMVWFERQSLDCRQGSRGVSDRLLRAWHQEKTPT